MKKSQKMRVSLSKVVPVVLLGVFLILFAVIFFTMSGETSRSVSASAAPQPTPEGQKRFKATKPIVVDKQSGSPRMPTDDEVEKLVSDLRSLTKQTEGLPETNLRNGGVAVDLEGGFGGTMLARPNADGTMETRCVFSFEEGAAFLGLVEDTL